MSSVAQSWGSVIYKPKSVLLFVFISFVAHSIVVALAYQTGIFSSDDIDSIATKKISISLAVPTPITPPTPIKSPEPKPKKVTPKKIVTKAATAKKVSPKPKKVVKKKAPAATPKVTPKKVASPLPSPVKKPALFMSPQPTYQPKPKYPSVARRRGVEGSVIFDLSVANDGRVTRAIIIQSSGSSALDRSALKTIQTWRFPASKFNSLSTYKQKIEFRLNSY